MADLNDLIDALYGPADREASTKATSIRLPEQVHRAAQIATELGMAETFTAATTEALLDHIRAFVRQRALAGHLEAFPQDQPSLADVAMRRVEGTDHPASRHPEAVAEVARWFEARPPAWASSGQVDEAADRVLEHVELLVERADSPSSASPA